MRIVTLAALLALLAVTAVAAPVDGTWKASMPGRDGGTMEQVFKLKADGAALTGTISGMGGETAISEGKVAGDKITFKVKREFNGNSMVFVYEGAVGGDEIKFKMTREGSDRPPREFVAKKAN